MRDRTGEVSWDSWDSILVENPGRVQPDRFGPPVREEMAREEDGK